LFAAHDVDYIEFAALDTLQYGLARHAKRADRFPHWHEAIAGFAVEAGHEVIGSGGCARGRRVVSCSPAMNAVIEQAMDGRWCDAEHDSAFLIVSSSPSGAPAVGSKHGISQWRRRLPTRPAVKR